MDINELSSMMSNTIEKLREMLENDVVIGKPVIFSDITIIPVRKLTAGFVTGGFDMKIDGLRGTPLERPLAAVGGGATASPVGFLVVSQNHTEYIAGDSSYKQEKWADFFHSIFKDRSK
ncbi:MAG: hypothetical protein LBE09_01025 [Christensenellaceae bacterium]|jgi:uncharacterized spore protein YtfJ|nr:hypothetical protein [Christensenellaceae bacterium]